MATPGSRNRRRAAAGKEVGCLHLGERLFEGEEDPSKIVVGVGSREKPRAALPEMYALVTHVRVEEAGVRDVRREVEAEPRRERGHAQRGPDLRRVGVQFVDELSGARVERALQVRSGFAKAFEHGLGRGERERMTDEGPGEERHPYLGERVVPVTPLATIERVHVLAVARHESDGQSAADHFSVRSEVRPDPEQRLGAALVGPESRNNLVEDEGRLRLLGDRAELTQEFHGLEFRTSALHRFDEHRGELR